MPRRRSASGRAAPRPRPVRPARSAACTVVSGGVTIAASGMSSKPTTLSSSGTRTPSSVQSAEDPDRHEVVVRQDGGGAELQHRSVTAAPLGKLGPPPGLVDDPLRCPGPRAHERRPRRRSRLDQERRGPATNAQRLWPSAARWRSARRIPPALSMTTDGRPGTRRLSSDQRRRRLEPRERGGRQTRGAEHDPVDLLTHRADQRLLLGRVLVAVGHEHRVVGFARSRLCALEDGVEVRIAEVGHDHADIPGAAGDQPTRRPVGLVAELGGRRQHPRPCGPPHGARCGEGSRHGRDRDSGAGGDVVDAGGHGAFLQTCVLKRFTASLEGSPPTRSP